MYTQSIEFDRRDFIVRWRLNNNFQLRRKADQVRNDIDRTRYQIVVEQHHVGRKALEGSLQTCQRVDLQDQANIVFERENISCANPVDGLRIGQDGSNPIGTRTFDGLARGIVSTGSDYV